MHHQEALQTRLPSKYPFVTLRGCPQLHNELLHCPLSVINRMPLTLCAIMPHASSGGSVYANSVLHPPALCYNLLAPSRPPTAQSCVSIWKMAPAERTHRAATQPGDRGHFKQSMPTWRGDKKHECIDCQLQRLSVSSLVDGLLWAIQTVSASRST